MSNTIAGWRLKEGKLDEHHYEYDDYWQLMNGIFSSKSKKRNSYKFAFFKSIMDNLAVCTDQNNYQITYKQLFEKFTHNYWNLICKYNIRQMRKDGKSEISRVEVVLQRFLSNELNSCFIEFDKVQEEKRNRLISEVELDCKQYVIGALYNDFQGMVYGFSKEEERISLNKNAVDFLIKYKKSIQIINYYYWAKFLCDINPPENVVDLLDKLELSTPARSDLSLYKKLLLNNGASTCFYCGKPLGTEIHVDHFIPWSFIHDDNLWNFVLSCPKCNIKKKDFIVGNKMIDIIRRNSNLVNNNDYAEFLNGYSEESFRKVVEYAIKQGYQDISVEKLF